MQPITIIILVITAAGGLLLSVLALLLWNHKRRASGQLNSHEFKDLLISKPEMTDRED